MTRIVVHRDQPLDQWRDATTSYTLFAAYQRGELAGFLAEGTSDGTVTHRRIFFVTDQEIVTSRAPFSWAEDVGSTGAGRRRPIRRLRQERPR